jgi:IclR family transcriptional regulator, pca regulon regulatory protein
MNDKGRSIAVKRPDRVGSLEKGIGLLDILAANPAGLTLSQVAEKAKLTRAGARRLLLSLVATGYVGQEGRRFLLTPRLLTLAKTWLEGVSLWDFALPYMREVAAALNESCSAAILADTDVVYVARVPGERIMSVALSVGTRLPAYCTSMGRVLLSDLPSPELDNLLRRAPMRAYTGKTLMNRIEIARAVRRAGEQGYAVVDEELEIGLRSIAVPIRDRGGRIVAAINVPAQSSRYTVQELERVALPRLEKAAAAIENFFVVQ